MWYVIMDDEGPWITQEPSEGDEILFQSENQTEAETVLCRECNGWESEHDDMNDFDGDEEDEDEEDEEDIPPTIKVYFASDGLYRVFKSGEAVFQSIDWNAVKTFAATLGWHKELCDN